MAPATEYQGSYLCRISMRRNQIVSMDVNHEQQLEDVEIFQRHVADRLASLLPPPPSTTAEDGGAATSALPVASETMLSISWLRKLLDVFLCCEAEFKAVLMTGRDPNQILKPPLDRPVTEMLDRFIKALDICSAAVNGVDAVRNCQRLAEIAVTAMRQRPLSHGNVTRAKRAFANLTSALNIDENKNSGGRVKNTERSWSFSSRDSRTGSGGATPKGGGSLVSATGYLRWSFGQNWSAARQIQAMSANLVAPRGGEASSLPPLVYIMSTIIVFVTWVLVAAIPCGGRNSLATYLPLPKHLGWASAAVSIQDIIGELLKKRAKNGLGIGLMDEMQKMERLVLRLMEFAEGFTFPAEAETEEEVAEAVAEMAEVCERMEEGLLPLQRQVREVFHRMVKSRAEILDVLEQAEKGKGSHPNV